MKFPVLFRHRKVVRPTLMGWFVILVGFGLVGSFGARNIAVFLAVNDPVGGDYLVIEGWMGKQELNQALDSFVAGKYEHAIIVGGPIKNDFHGLDHNYAVRAANYLVAEGMPAEKLAAVIAAPYSARDRTFLNAAMTRAWFERERIDPLRLDVVTSDVHARRSQYLYRLAFGEEIEIGVIPARPDWFELSEWWRSSDSAKHVAVEFVGWAVDRCCFFPGEPASYFRQAGVDI